MSHHALHGSYTDQRFCTHLWSFFLPGGIFQVAGWQTWQAGQCRSNNAYWINLCWNFTFLLPVPIYEGGYVSDFISLLHTFLSPFFNLRLLHGWLLSNSNPPTHGTLCYCVCNCSQMEMFIFRIAMLHGVYCKRFGIFFPSGALDAHYHPNRFV